METILSNDGFFMFVHMNLSMMVGYKIGFDVSSEEPSLIPDEGSSVNVQFYFIAQVVTVDALISTT